MKALLPEEAMPEGDTLRLSDDKQFCMQEMKRSMQNNMESTAWPTTQYLWSLHPIFGWVNDKASLLCPRNKALVAGIKNNLSEDEAIFVVHGSFPNLKSTPVVDQWFGLLYKDGVFKRALTMQEVIKSTGISSPIPNTNEISQNDLEDISIYIEDVVSKAKEFLSSKYREYKDRIDPQIDEEINKLGELEQKHKSYQLSLFESEKSKDAAERRVDRLFDSFEKWVKETLTIQDNPYIKIVAIFKGVE